MEKKSSTPSLARVFWGIKRLSHALRPEAATGGPKNEPLPFRNVMELLDEMHSVPCADAGDGTCIPSPLSDAHSRILSVLGLK
ncbi:MAG: hypothetical protein II047_05805 [Bacteroidales bacterium]|nr:hypothetical protein [Bacteroidales bacterium]